MSKRSSSLAEISPSYRLFLGFVLFIFCINLLVVNDFATFWDGAEVALMNKGFSATTSPIAYLHEVKLNAVAAIMDFNEFWLRLPSVFITLIGFGGIYFLGKRIFGEATITDALLILGSSFLVVNLGKVATGDSWLFALLTLNFITLILYLKQPVLKWKISHLVLLILATWVHPLSAFIFSIGTTIYLFWLHPKGQNLKGLHHWIIWLMLLPILYFLDLINFHIPTFYLSYGNIRVDQYLLWMLVGMLPWTGFIWAGLWEMFQKLRKKEEFAIITSAGFFIGLLSHSLVVQAILAFIVARQLKAYFHPNYPYKNIVRTGATLHLIFAIGAIIYMMISSFDLFYLVGFRSAMAVGAMYWMPALIAVIGLFGMNHRFIKGGMALSGLMVTLVFWLQLYPLVEAQRNLPKRITTEVNSILEKNTKQEVPKVYYHSSFATSSIEVYLKQQANAPLFFKNENMDDLYPKGHIIVATDSVFQTLKIKNAEIKGTEIKGWGQLLKEETFWVVKK